MSRKFEANHAALVLFTGALVVSTMLVGFWTWSGLNANLRERGNARSRMLAWQEVFSTIVDAETGARGFVITGQDSYLDPYRSASKRLEQTLAKAVDLETRVDGAGGEAHALALSNAANAAMEEVTLTATVASNDGQEAATTLIRDNTGKLAMDVFRTMATAHLHVLDGNVKKFDEALADSLRAGGMSMAALGLAAIIAGAAAWSLMRVSARQEQRNARLAAEREKAERRSMEKSSFLATMSHEVRTPMNAILGFGELLEGEVGDAKLKSYARSIVTSGRALLQIINDVLDLSKIEAGMMDIALEPCNVRELVVQIEQLFGTQMTNKGVTFFGEVAAGVPSSLLLDSMRLRQVLVNLVGNALKFTDTGSVVLRIFGHRDNSVSSRYCLMIEVADTGIGIAPEKQEQIFRPFVQSGTQKEREMKGTGLGLAIVKRLVQLMRGSIEVDSKQGKGATFRIRLPEAEVSARLPKAMTESDPVVDFAVFNPSRILVVDDNEVNRELVRSFFAGTDHELIEAENGLQAIEAIEIEKPDVVLMDIRMPILDGREALEHLRQKRDLDLMPVIAVTASSMAKEEEVLRKVFNGYLRKPFSRHQLFQELERFVAKVDPPVPTAKEILPHNATDWRELARQLRETEANDWPGVRDGMVLSEVIAFGNRLRSLATKHGCPKLECFANQLIEEGESFSLGNLEKSLAAFPALVEEITVSTAP